jgi:hypothetical protein
VFDASRDQWLLDHLRSLGYPIVNPPLVISNAHQACRLLQQGESTVQMNQQMSSRYIWLNEERRWVTKSGQSRGGGNA